MKRERLTMSQALVKFLDNQYVEFDGVETKFVSGIFGIFGKFQGHGRRKFIFDSIA